MIPAPPPPPETLPANVVAIVVQVPDLRGEQGGVITSRDFNRALVQGAAQEGRRVAPKPDSRAYRRLKNSVMGELLDDAWIRGQAAEMGIGVRPRGVARKLVLLKRQAFKNGAEYRRFLREARYTRRDVNERVELQMFSERILERVMAGFASEKGEQKAFAKFVAEYEERWRSRTVCAAGFVTYGCSNGPAPAAESAS